MCWEYIDIIASDIPQMKIKAVSQWTAIFNIERKPEKCRCLLRNLPFRLFGYKKIPGLCQDFFKISAKFQGFPGLFSNSRAFQDFPGLVGTMRGWKGRKDGRVVRWEGGRFLILFKGGGCRVSPIFHLFVFNFKGYLCYKMITSKNVPSEAQVKNFFIS